MAASSQFLHLLGVEHLGGFSQNVQVPFVTTVAGVGGGPSGTVHSAASIEIIRFDFIVFDRTRGDVLIVELDGFRDVQRAV